MRTLNIARVPELVHDDGNLPAMLLCQDVVQQGGFARAQIPCDDGQGDFVGLLDQLRADPKREMRQLESALRLNTAELHSHKV